MDPLKRSSVTSLGIDRQKNLSANMLATLSCPLCLEYMTPPITMCVAGHSICHACRGAFSRCPSCEKPLVATRNVALENIARSIQYPCRFSPQGCRAVRAMKDIAKHHASCKYAIYNCPLSHRERCEWTGRRPEILTHVTSSHANAALVFDVSAGRCATWEISNSDCYHESFQAVFVFDEIFIYHKIFDIPQKKLCLTVQQFGHKEKRTRFRYELEIHKNNGDQLVTFSNMVHSDSDVTEVIYQAGDCIKVDFDMLMSFVKGVRRMKIFHVTTSDRDAS